MSRTGISLLAGVLATTAFARGDDPAAYYRRGMSRMAAARLRAALEASPDDITAMSMLAINWSRSAFYADAVASFALCTGSALYEREGLQAHANALRETGDPLAAAALRETLLATPMPLQKELSVLVGLADDHMAAGELPAAEAALLAAEALAPNSALVHAAIGELALREGDLEEASARVWLISVQPTSRAVRARLLEAQVLLALGDQQAAEAVVTAARAAVPESMPLAALQARLLRLGGDPSMALSLLTRPRWSFNEHPDILQQRALAYHATGAHQRAAEQLALLESRYPDQPTTHQTADAIRR